MAVMDAVTAVDQLIELAKKLKERCDNMKKNPEEASILLRIYEAIWSQVAGFGKYNQDTLQSLEFHHRENLLAELKTLSSQADSAKQKLQDKVDRMEGKFYAFTHANRNAATFAELAADAVLAQGCVGRINGILATANLINRAADRVVKSFAELVDRLADELGGAPLDKFHARFDAPPNPPSILIDFDSTDAEGRPATFEARLKAALLRSTATGSFGVIAQGMSGVGKTCALRALAADDDVIARFEGGVYFMVLGAQATNKTIIRQLARSIEASGGKTVAAELQNEESLVNAISKCQTWFAQERCLFVFDDLWQSCDIGHKVLQQLSVLVNDCRKELPSRLLFSTRGEWLTLQGHSQETVSFKAREARGKESKAMLLGAAGVKTDEMDSDSNDSAVLGILDSCAGLPAALNLCGTAVKWMQSTYDGDRKDLWKEYFDELESKILLTEYADSYGPLGAALTVSLEFLDNRRKATEGQTRQYSYKEMHRALCVLRKQGWIPVCDLMKLWNLPDVRCAKGIVMEMRDVGVAHEERRKLDDGVMMLGLRLHDLVHYFARQQTIEHREVTKWPAALLDAYRVSPYEHSQSSSWQFDMSSGHVGVYMIRNVCRLLVEALRFNELEALLHSVEWSLKILEINDVLLLEEGVELYLESCRGRHETSQTPGFDGRDAEERRSLKALCKIVRQSMPYCAGSVLRAWFQLYARLMATTDKPKWMIDMMAKADTQAPRPWIKALSPCLRGPRDALLDTYLVQNCVKCVKFANDDIMSLGYYAMGGVFIGNYGANGKNEELQLRWASSQTAEGNSSHISPNEGFPPQIVKTTCGSIFEDGTRVVTGSRGGAVRVSDAKTGEVVWAKTNGHGSPVSSVAVTLGGGRLAVGATDGTMWIWNVDTEIQVGPLPTRHSGAVCGIAFSADGRRVSSGSSDGTVRVWEAEDEQLMRWSAYAEPFSEHIDSVWSVAVSADGRRVVSGSSDQTIRVWNLENEPKVGPTLTGHMGAVVCVALSRDGQRVVSGSIDKTVRVWDADTGRQVFPAFTGHTGLVHSVALSADGWRIVSGSSDHTVRVWDVCSGDHVGQTLAGQSGQVLSVAMSRNKQRVVAGSDRGTVLVWDTKNGTRVGPELRVPSNLVYSVAVSEDGRRVVSGSDDETVRVWDARSRKQVGPTHPGRGAGQGLSVAFSKDGQKVVSGSTDGTVIVCNAETGEQEGPSLTGHRGLIRNVAISDDGHRVVSSSIDRMVRVWDAQTGEHVELAVAHKSKWRSVALSGDGRRVATWGSGYEAVQMFDAMTGLKMKQELHGHTGNVHSLALSVDGRRVVSGGADGLRFWDADSATCLRVFKDVDWMPQWAYLSQRLLDRSESARADLPEYMAQGMNIIHRCGGSERVVATLEADITWFNVVERDLTVVALQQNGVLAFLRIVQ